MHEIRGEEVWVIVGGAGAMAFGFLFLCFSRRRALPILVLKSAADLVSHGAVDIMETRVIEKMR